jgi:hypothetical protein
VREARATEVFTHGLWNAVVLTEDEAAEKRSGERLGAALESHLGAPAHIVQGAPQAAAGAARALDALGRKNARGARARDLRALPRRRLMDRPRSHDLGALVE